MRIPLNSIVIYLLGQWIKHSEGACTFPTELVGEWYSAHKGLLTFNSTALTSYPIAMSASVTSLDFTCEEQSGYKYFLRATQTAFIFGNDYRGYLCIDLRRVSEYKYYYYMGTKLSATNNDNIYARVDGLTVAMADACNEPEPYHDGSFITLIKNGSVESGHAQATCPEQFLARYDNVTVANADGSTTCTGSAFDACTDKTVLNHTYASCTSGLIFSSGGSLTCLHSIVNDSFTFLSVWNNDVTVDGSTTFRFSCYIISQNGDVTYATEVPYYCSDSSHTSTSVTSPGITHVYSSRTETCVATSSLPDYVTYIIVIIVGVVVLVILIIVMVCCIKNRKKLKECCKRCCRNKKEKRKSSGSSWSSQKGLTPLDAKRREWRINKISLNMIQPVGKVELLYQKSPSVKSNPSRRSSLSSIASFGSMFSLNFKS
ncbi:uncharacterized protein LOC117329019 isoform X2 [Pecten maximus]|uniref:uncharacterized protein LOC117329019 isoform X2 n=1 Tax=Pecten maximus TaxID=6579 RepID=UPI0014589F1F|nr:uncharacterized protein LOC117329019 isoform X2 [Pecten maximus]